VLRDRTKPVLKHSASTADLSAFIRESGGGDMTAAHLRTIQNQGKQASNLMELANLVRDLQVKHEIQKAKEKKMIETVLNDPYTRGNLFSSANSPPQSGVSTPKDSPRSDAPLLRGGNWIKANSKSNKA